MLKRTPCVGICSTTYGDLVCRGCKRFAHEIVQWNGFDEEQRRAVWWRLVTIRRGAVRDFVQLVHTPSLIDGARKLGMGDVEEQEPFDLAYEVLRRVQRRYMDLAELGLAAHPGKTPGRDEADPARWLLQNIDREFYERSMAHYERSYRTLAQ